MKPHHFIILFAVLIPQIAADCNTPPDCSFCHLTDYFSKLRKADIDLTYPLRAQSDLVYNGSLVYNFTVISSQYEKIELTTYSPETGCRPKFTCAYDAMGGGAMVLDENLKILRFTRLEGTTADSAYDHAKALGIECHPKDKSITAFDKPIYALTCYSIARIYIPDPSDPSLR